MTYFIYNTLLYSMSIIASPYFLCKLVFTEKHRMSLLQRFGKLPQSLIADGKSVWIHAVSVGEVAAATPFIDEFRKTFPDYRILLSTVTATGNQFAKKIKNIDGLFFFPFDYSFAIKKAIKHISPNIFITFETEIWPNFLKYAQDMKIPCILVNGRISPDSFKRYKKVKFFFKHILKNFSAFCMQTEQDRTRIMELGAEKRKVRVTGNTKFDALVSNEENIDIKKKFVKIFGIEENDKVIIAGSTHRGEEEKVLDAFQYICQKVSNVLLILAPRHPERFQEVTKLLEDRNIDYILRSTLDKTKREEQQVIILDTIGELSKLYTIADVVFIGGSLVPTGGHNVIEPASLGKPVVFGPYMYNFTESANLLLENKGAIQIADEAGLAACLLKLILDSEYAEQTGKAAKKAVQQNKGASKRNLEVISEFLRN
ncbi:MAG: 3-deoxy-D-manno-octulosonic acid transferase [bacterium]|nr:3-deoxy-D-manno-octulosonic acid transferase [bacterium]